MDNDTHVTEMTGSTLPRASTFESTPAPPPSSSTTQDLTTYEHSAPSADDKGRNGVFGHLVKDDGDIAGLVAYSIYKQHKLDWLRAFEVAQSRAPDEAELNAYIIGEGTPRRLATYRHLAEATLAGNGPDVDGSKPVGREIGRRHSITTAQSPFRANLIAIYTLIAVLFVLGFWFALHFTVATH